jgi:hypothetical protein
LIGDGDHRARDDRAGRIFHLSGNGSECSLAEDHAWSNGTEQDPKKQNYPSRAVPQGNEEIKAHDAFLSDELCGCRMFSEHFG